MDSDLQCLDWLQNFTLPAMVCETSSVLPSGVCLSSSSPAPSASASEGSSSNSTMVSPVPYAKYSCCRRIGCMIFRAIDSSPYRALPLSDIYATLHERTGRSYTGGTARFQNHVRHVLSDSCCFVRLKRLKLQSGLPGVKLQRSWWALHPFYQRLYRKPVLATGDYHRCLPKMTKDCTNEQLTADSVSQPILHVANAELDRLVDKFNIAATMLSLRKFKTSRMLLRRYARSRRRSAVRMRASTQKRVLLSAKAEDDHCYVTVSKKSSVSEQLSPSECSSFRVSKALFPEEARHQSSVIVSLPETFSSFPVVPQSLSCLPRGFNAEDSSSTVGALKPLDIEDLCSTRALLVLSELPSPIHQPLL